MAAFWLGFGQFLTVFGCFLCYFWHGFKLIPDCVWLLFGLVLGELLTVLGCFLGYFWHGFVRVPDCVWLLCGLANGSKPSAGPRFKPLFVKTVDI